LNNFVHVVFLDDFIFSNVLAFHALLNQDILPFFQLNVNGLHQAAAFRGAVTGINVHVLAPKTMRAMVGITVAFYFRPAIFAGEIFDFPLEFFRHKIKKAEIRKKKNIFLSLISAFLSNLGG
jgi:hypothetical protein